ncbi:ATP-binding protein [Paenisporosarcina sp. NPDC076898]|uniref:ATP-binding protein n=1 Tax=unclassified Paenisporosarcina TaxID=2642018 RepID=UPI003CFF117E
MFAKQMDKASFETWRHFLKNATISNHAKSRICLSDLENREMYFELEGCYNQSADQYIIHFKQTPEKFVNQNYWAGSVNYKSLFENAPDGIILTNYEGIIIDANLKVEKLFDVSLDNLIGRNSTIIFDRIPHSNIEFNKFLETLFLRGNAKMVLSKIDANGEPRYYHVTSVFDEILEMYITLIHDDTENYALKRQIEHSQSLSTLGQMAASIAHEVRNPLTSLEGFIQLLTNQVTEQGHQYLDIVDSELTRMESILNEFLTLSKPTTRSLKMISVSSIIKQIVYLMQPQGISQNIELEFITWEKDSDIVLGDADELKKVFMNILKNSMEVMPHGGKVIITQTLREDNQLWISVKDQGVGMTPEQLQHIFLPFYTSKEHGTGLGLAHAMQTIENHGGSIEVESEISKGTTFHIILPIYQLESSKEKTTHDQRHTKPFREVISSN